MIDLEATPIIAKKIKGKMKNFDFTNSEHVKKLKKELDEILESRIRVAETNSVLDSLCEQPFGAIKNVFESITDKLYETKEGKALISKYVRAIREGKNVSNMYMVNECVHHAPHVSNPEMFLNEAISISDGFDAKAYDAEKRAVGNVVKEAAKLVGLNSTEINESVGENYEINKSIDYIISNPKKFSNLSEYVNNFNTVCEYLQENMQAKPSDDAEKTGTELIDELNESMEGLKDWEKGAIRDIAMARLSKANLSQVFESYKNRCIEKLDRAIENGTSIEETSHLQGMRERLNEKKASEETFNEDILTLAELEMTLENKE